MARTLKIEMTDKQYVALVFRMQRDGVPDPETMLAVPPIIHEKTEANTGDGIKVYEDAYSTHTAISHAPRYTWRSHAKATTHAIFGSAARSPIRFGTPTSPTSSASWASNLELFPDFVSVGADPLRPA